MYGTEGLGSWYKRSGKSGSSTTGYKKKCPHEGISKIGRVEDCTIWAASEDEARRNLNHIEPEILVCLNGKYGRRAVLESDLDIRGDVATHLPTLARHHNGRHRPDTIVTVEWPDYGAPWMRRRWWKSLAEDLQDLDGDVIFFCKGGHGRTGTAITIVATMMGLVPPDEDPVLWVRDQRCDNCVESGAQIDYLEQLDIHTRVRISKRKRSVKKKSSTDNDDGSQTPSGASEDDNGRNTSNYGKHYSEVSEGLSSLFPTVEAPGEEPEDRQAWPVDNEDNPIDPDVEQMTVDYVREHPGNQWATDPGQCVVCHNEAPYNESFDCFICEEHIGSKL